MVAKRTLPRTRTSGSRLGSSVVSPLQPNQTPPVFCRAARTPTARPPGAVPRRGREIRLDTQTRRPTDDPPFPLALAPAQPAKTTLFDSGNGGDVRKSAAGDFFQLTRGTPEKGGGSAQRS